MSTEKRTMERSYVLSLTMYGTSVLNAFEVDRSEVDPAPSLLEQIQNTDEELPLHENIAE